MTGNIPYVSDSWTHLLWGLWLSEALELSWDDPHKIRVDLTTYRHPMLVLPGASQKNRKDQVTPITPDFAEWLLSQPNKAGDVFCPLARSGDRIDMVWASRIISRCGETAGIITKKDAKGDKFASAHDLRRSFGARWAVRTTSAILKDLMRHASITTTEEFYLGVNAESAADQLYAASPPQGQLGGVLGGSGISSPQPNPPKTTKTLKNVGKT